MNAEASPENSPERNPGERDLLTVLVPCLNEEATVEASVNTILAEKDELPVDLEILLIDDGSTDGTQAKMEELREKHPECRIRVHHENQGVGRAVLDAYNHIRDRSWVTVLPGDNEILFSSIKSYLKVADDYDLLLGYFGNPIIRTSTRRFASYCFSRTVNLLYGFPYRYLNGLKMYRVEVFRGIDVISSGHAFNAELLAKAILRNPLLRVGEVPFIARGRVAGSSKAFRPLSIWRAVRDVMKGYFSVAEYRREMIRQASEE